MRAREFIIEAAYDSMVASMKQKYPHAAEYIDQWTQWAKATLKKSESVVWFLKILRGQIAGTLTPKEIGNYEWIDVYALSVDLLHFYGYNYQPIEDYQYQNKPIGQVIADLKKLEEKWRELQSKTQGVPIQEGDYKLFEFADGTAWWFVDRAYCPEEGRSGGHCGNVVGQQQTDQRILSLRTKNNQVICTFILEPDGTLGEMKAVNNRKPEERYHPHIIKLLMWDHINGIAPTDNQYNPDANFNIFDLDETNFAYIDQNKPELILSQIQSSPVSALRMPNSFKPKYKDAVVKANPAMGTLLENPSSKDWETAIARDAKMILYAPENLREWEERVIETISGYMWEYNDRTGERTAVKVDDDLSFEDRELLLLQAPSHISKNPKLVRDIVELNPDALMQVNPNIRNYAEIATVAVKASPFILEYVPEDKRTEQLCKTAVKKNGSTLRYVPEKLHTQELANLAVQTSGAAIKYMDDRFKTPELCKQAVKRYSRALEAVPVELLTPEMYLLAMNHEPRWAVDFIPAELKTAEFFKQAVENNARALAVVPYEFITPEMCKFAVDKNPLAIEDVPDHMQTAELWIRAVKDWPRLARQVPVEFANEVALAVTKR